MYGALLDVKSISVNFEAHVCYPCCGCSLWMRSVLLASEANFDTSLDVGVPFLSVGPVLLVLGTNLLMLPWAREV